MTIAEAIARARDALVAGGVPREEAPGDAEVLARHVLGWDLTTLAVSRREGTPSGFEERYDALIERRTKREPVSQIVGHREFWGLEFEVNRDVLTPRPETELIVEEAIAAFPNRDAGLIVDVGTGSGCLAVALAREFPNALLIATDVSERALAVARRNAARHGVDRRIAFLSADLLPPAPGDIDLLVSNPPYIPVLAATELPPEVRDFEPAVALFSADGLDMYRRLSVEAWPRMRRDGVTILEVGYDEAQQVAAIMERVGWLLRSIRKDLQNIPRTLVFHKP